MLFNGTRYMVLGMKCNLQMNLERKKFHFQFHLVAYYGAFFHLDFGTKVVFASIYIFPINMILTEFTEEYIT